MTANQEYITQGKTYEITQASELAVKFFSKADELMPDLMKKFPQLGALHDEVCKELTNCKTVDQVPLFGFSLAGFGGSTVQAGELGEFSPSAIGNSGRSPSGRA